MDWLWARSLSSGENMDSIAADKLCMTDETEHARAQSSVDFLSDMRKMINNPECSDITFLCQNHALVHASRLLLVARCPMMKCMLMNGMAESRLTEIPLPHIPSTVLLSVLEFLYTGLLVKHVPNNWLNAFEIMSAARFFLLHNLELIVLDYLVVSTTEVESDMTAAAKFLSVAVEFYSTCDSVEVILSELVTILNSRCLETVHLRSLSEKAFDYFLDKTKNDLTDVRTLSFDEYLRLRLIILWCSCKLWPEEADEVVESCMPDLKSSLSMLQNPGNPDFWPQTARFIGKKTELAITVASMLPFVDLRRIHPELLVKVIEPMEIIPDCQMMGAMRFHALQRRRKTDRKVHEWHFRGSKSTDIYSVCRDGSVIEQIGAGIGFVRYTFAINRPYGFYEWDICIEKVCDLFYEVGILHEANKSHVDGSSLAEQPGGWALRMDAHGVFINRRGTHTVQKGDPGFSPYGNGKDYSHKVYGKDFGNKNTRVRVHLDMFEHCCSFSVDKENFGIAWTNLPDGTYYPAVSLGGGSRGRARINLISGFDIL